MRKVVEYIREVTNNKYLCVWYTYSSISIKTVVQLVILQLFRSKA